MEAASHLPGQPNIPFSSKKKTKAGVYTSDVTFASLASVFHLPCHKACEALGLGLTIFKRLCRKHGVYQWPYRALKQHKLAESFDPQDEAVQRILEACQQPSLQQQRDASPDSADLLHEGSCSADHAMEDAEQGWHRADAASLQQGPGAVSRLSPASCVGEAAEADARGCSQGPEERQQQLQTQQQQQHVPAAAHHPVRVKLESPGSCADPRQSSQSNLDVLLSAVEAEEAGTAGTQPQALTAGMREASGRPQPGHRLGAHGSDQAAGPRGFLGNLQRQAALGGSSPHDAQRLIAERRNQILQQLALALRAGKEAEALAGGPAATPQLQMPATPQQQLQQQQQQQLGPLRGMGKAELLRMASQLSHMADELDAQARSAEVAALLRRFQSPAQQPPPQQAPAAQQGPARAAAADSPELLRRLMALKQLLQLQGAAAAGGLARPTAPGQPDGVAAVATPASVSLQAAWSPQAWLPGQSPFSAALDLQRRSSGGLIPGLGSCVAATRSLSEPLPSGLLLPPGARTASAALSLSRSSSGFTRFSTQGSCAGAVAGVAPHAQRSPSTLARGLPLELPDPRLLAQHLHQ